jgi:hypothetical protein
MAFDGATGDPPVEGDVGSEGDGEILFLRAHGPIERGADVGLLHVDGPEPFALPGSSKRGAAALAQIRHVLRHAPKRRVGLASLDQALPSVLGQRLEHPVASLGTRTVNGHQRLVDQPGDALQDLDLVQIGVGGSSLRCRDRAAAGEHGQPFEHRRSSSKEQVELQSTTARSVCWRSIAVRAP